MPTMDEVKSWRGATLVDRDGDKIGSIDEVYLDQETGRPEWLAVKTGLFGTRLSFVPLAEATPGGDEVRVPYEKAQVKDAPNVDADGELSQQEEQRLYRHYGLGYSESRSDTGFPEGQAGMTGTSTDTGRRDAEARDRDAVGRDVSGPTTDDAMTRSEEELRVGTREREAGRVRLRKWVETEPVQTTVQTRREEARIEREPITDANLDDAMDGPEISEEEHEVTLHAEEPVVEKRTVPKERVRATKDSVTDETEVSDQVRKERVEADDDTESRRRR
jgi:uncharacterized protein (TIGR02271 family)